MPQKRQRKDVSSNHHICQVWKIDNGLMIKWLHTKIWLLILKTWIYCEEIWWLPWNDTVEVWFGYQHLPFHEGIWLFSQKTKVICIHVAFRCTNSWISWVKRCGSELPKTQPKPPWMLHLHKRPVFGEVDLRVVNWCKLGRSVNNKIFKHGPCASKLKLSSSFCLTCFV